MRNEETPSADALREGSRVADIAFPELKEWEKDLVSFPEIGEEERNISRQIDGQGVPRSRQSDDTRKDSVIQRFKDRLIAWQVIKRKVLSHVMKPNGHSKHLTFWGNIPTPSEA